jgi:dihydroorotase
MGQKGEQLTEMADLRDAGAVGGQRRRTLRHQQPGDAPRARVRGDVRSSRSSSTPRTTRSPRARRCTRGPSRRGSAFAGGRASPRTSSSRAMSSSPSTSRARYHVAHVSTMPARCAWCARPSRAASTVTAEVTPHHLLLTDEALLGYDTACKVNPPLREPEDVEALRRALADGTIDCIATDHAPHGVLDKNVEIRRGRAGDDRPRALRAASPRARPRGGPPPRPPRRRADGGARRASRGFPRPGSATARAPTSCSSNPTARWTMDPARLLREEPEHALRGARGRRARGGLTVVRGQGRS